MEEGDKIIQRFKNMITLNGIFVPRKPLVMSREKLENG